MMSIDNVLGTHALEVQACNSKGSSTLERRKWECYLVGRSEDIPYDPNSLLCPAPLLAASTSKNR